MTWQLTSIQCSVYIALLPLFSVLLLNMKFLLFPDLAQFRIVEQLPLADLLVFSNCSSKTKEIVKAARIELDFSKWTFREKQLKVQLVRASTNGLKLRLYHSARICQNACLDGQYGCRLELESGPRWFFDWKSDEHTEQFSMFLLNTFRFPKIRLELVLETSPVNFFMFRLTRNFQRLSIRNRMRLSCEEMLFLLDEIHVEEECSLVISPIDGSFQYSEGLSFPIISLRDRWNYYCEWLHFDSILNSKSRLMDIQFFNPTVQDLNAFIMKWIRFDGLQNLVSLSLGWYDPYESLSSKREIFKGIEKVEWRADTEKYFRTVSGLIGVRRQDTQKVFDVTRDDGEKATVVLRVGFFGFFVKDEEYKKRDGNKI